MPTRDRRPLSNAVPSPIAISSCSASGSGRSDAGHGAPPPAPAGRSSAPDAELALELAIALERASARRPSAIASWIAHPGSVSCAQSAKRHAVASSATSANVSSTPAPAAQRPSSRIPGCRGRARRPGAARARGAWSCAGPSRRCGAPAPLALPAEQAVEERRLAHAGRAEQRHRPSAADVGRERVEPRAVERQTACTGTPNATASTSATAAGGSARGRSC